MQSKTAVLFPGLDALFVSSKLKQWAELDKVKDSLSEASKILSQFSKQDENLHGFIVENRRHHIVDFDRTLIVLTVLQVAIAKLVREKISWNIVQGCSHGDIARNVICGVMSLENAIEILWEFSKLRKICPQGYTASIRTTLSGNMTEEQISWLNNHGARVSRWSLSHGTIGGKKDLIDKLSKDGEKVNLKIKPILSYPVHSDAMEPIVDDLLAYAKLWKFNNSEERIFSSIWLKFIAEGDEIFKEGVAGATEPVRWVETLEYLCEKENVKNFINIGPSNTLTGWLLESPEFSHVKVHEAWDLIQGIT